MGPYNVDPFLGGMLADRPQGVLAQQPQGAYQLPMPAAPVAPARSEFMDADRLKWAGVLLDVGNAFGNALAGTGAQGGNGLRMYMGAKQHNQALQDRYRQQQYQYADTMAQRQVQQAQVAKYLSDARKAGQPTPIGAPQKLGNGNLAQVVYDPTTGQTAVMDLNVPFYQDQKVIDLGGGVQGVLAARPGAGPAVVPLTTPEQVRTNTLTADPTLQPTIDKTIVDTQAAQATQERQAADRLAETQAKVAKAETMLAQYERMLKPDNAARVQYGVGVGRLPGSVIGIDPINDEFDALASQNVLEQAAELSGVLSDSDIKLLSSAGLDRTRSREYNEGQIAKRAEIVRAAIARERAKLGGTAAPAPAPVAPPAGPGVPASDSPRVYQINGVTIEELP